MHFIARLLGPVEKAFNKLGICTTVGFMAATITGFILFCFYQDHAVPVLTPAELLKIASLIWGFAFLIILFILVVFCRFTLGSVLIQTLVNTLLSSFGTTYFVELVQGWRWAIFIGAAIGLLIGRLLCSICHFIKGK